MEWGILIGCLICILIAVLVWGIFFVIKFLDRVDELESRIRWQEDFLREISLKVYRLEGKKNN